MKGLILWVGLFVWSLPLHSQETILGDENDPEEDVVEAYVQFDLLSANFLSINQLEELVFADKEAKKKKA